MAEFPMLSLGLSREEALVLLCCAEWSERFRLRLPPEKREYLEETQSTVQKLRDVYHKHSKDPHNPYDTWVEFSSNEQFVVDAALHMTMVDATIATLNPIADDYVSRGIKLSELAKFVPSMKQLLRRVQIAQQLTMLERKVEELQESVGRLAQTLGTLSSAE